MGEWNNFWDEIGRQPTLLSQQTQNFLLELIQFANRFTTKDRPELNIDAWLRIGWSSRESILEIVPLVESSSMAIAQEPASIRRNIDEWLAKGGYRMWDGRL
ncbi:MAG: hypothetical protein EOP04_10030 [Proteobacteria bacterium]|nr:MAG: hypothetical protein EOP04_10030 [Pseudomonadota bacterium]